MQRRTFLRTVTADRTDLLDRLLTVLAEQRARYCVVGGQAVNAYAEPVVSLDLGLVIAVSDLPELLEVLTSRFRVEHFPHSINVSSEGSDLRVQIQTDERYNPFVQRASTRCSAFLCPSRQWGTWCRERSCSYRFQRARDVS